MSQSHLLLPTRVATKAIPSAFASQAVTTKGSAMFSLRQKRRRSVEDGLDSRSSSLPRSHPLPASDSASMEAQAIRVPHGPILRTPREVSCSQRLSAAPLIDSRNLSRERQICARTKLSLGPFAQQFLLAPMPPEIGLYRISRTLSSTSACPCHREMRGEAIRETRASDRVRRGRRSP